MAKFNAKENDPERYARVKAEQDKLHIKTASSGFLSFHQALRERSYLMKTIIVSNEYYSVIDLTVEYDNWSGQEKYAVISDLAQEYIEEMFASELSEYKPYIYMANAFLDIRRDFRNNNKKSEMRSIRSESLFSFEDSDTETHHTEISVPDFVEQWIENYELKEAIKQLTDKERERLIE